MSRALKKLIILFLVLSMTVTVIGVAAEESKGVQDDGSIEAMEVLRLFSIIPDYYDYSVNETDNVSRADFVSSVAKMASMTDYSGDAYYYDVSQNHWAFNEISALTERGILSGVGDKLFGPDELITKNEAYKIVMTVLGYGDWAQYNGGYPNGYTSAAKRTKVSNGVSSNINVTVADMIKILYNAITTSVLEPTAYGSESTIYTADGQETILSLHRDIYYREGRMNGANQLAFDGSSLDDGEVLIDNIIYESDVELSDYLGERIKFFYHYDKTEDRGTILWAKPIDRGECLEISVDNDASFNKETYELSYIKGEKTVKAVLDRGMILVYNGGIVNENISDILNMDRYTAKLVKDDNGKYSIVIVKAYENYVVGSIDGLDYVIYDKANNNRVLKLDEKEYERLDLSVIGMTPVTFDEITAGNVLSVYLSKDKKYMEVHVSIDTVSGVIDSVKNTAEGKKVLIDAIEYFAPNSVKGEDLKAGQSVKLYLDSKGEIAFSEIQTSSYTPAYLISARTNRNAFDTTIKFRVLNKQGKIEVMECAETVKIDGKVYKDVNKAAAYLMPGGAFEPQFVMIRISSDGKIKMIDTVIDNPDVTEDDVLSVSVPMQGSVVYRKSSLGHKALIDSSTILFLIPDNIENAEDDEFGVLNSLTDWKTYSNVETYKVQDRIGYEQFVIVSGHKSSMYWESDVPMLVTSFSEILDENGDVLEGINGFQGNAERELTVVEGMSLKANGVSVGDVIRLKTNPDGTVDDYTMIYDYDKGAENAVIGGYASQIAFSVGYVTDLVDGVIKIGKTPGAYDISINTAGVPCVIYDLNSVKEKAYTGSVSSAKTFLNEGENCSMVVLTQSYTAPKMFVIYK